MQKKKKEILAYLAGVMDSDGSFGIKKDGNHARAGRNGKSEQINYSYRIRLAIAQVSLEAIALLQMTFGGSIRRSKPSTKNGKPMFRLDLFDRRAETATRALLPYLRIKKRQAELLLEVRKIKKQGLKGIHLDRAKTRWGKIALFKRRCWSNEQVNAMDSIRAQVMSLNDCRRHRRFQPKRIPHVVHT